MRRSFCVDTCRGRARYLIDHPPAVPAAKCMPSDFVCNAWAGLASGYMLRVMVPAFAGFSVQCPRFAGCLWKGEWIMSRVLRLVVWAVVVAGVVLCGCKKETEDGAATEPNAATASE